MLQFKCRLAYLQHEADLKALVNGIKIARQLAHADAFAEIVDTELAPGLDVTSDAAIAAYIRQAVNTFWHPVGTCKMGTDPMAVVDPELRVHGSEGLRIVDASIMPTIVTGNTNAPTIMIAEQAADLIKAAHSLPLAKPTVGIAHQSLQSLVSARGRHQKGEYAKETL